MSTRIERIQKRWERITPRERGLIVIMGVSMIVVILVMVSNSITDGLAELESETKIKRKALAALRDYQRGGQDRDISIPKVKIPEEGKGINLRSYLNGVATRVGVKIPGFNAKPKATKGNFVEVSTGISIQNLSIQDLAGLLSGIEKDPKVVVTSLKMRRSVRDKEKMNVELVIATYEKPKEKETKGDGG